MHSMNEKIKILLKEVNFSNKHLNETLPFGLICTSIAINTAINSYAAVKYFAIPVLLLFIYYHLSSSRINLHKILIKFRKSEMEKEITRIFRKEYLNFKKNYIFIITCSACFLWFIQRL